MNSASPLMRANLPKTMGSEIMALPWRNRMTGRLQDREIQSFMDTKIPQQSFGGMRYRNANPPANTIGITPEKITLFNEQTPIGGAPVNVTFDQTTKELVIAEGQGGIYEVVFNLNFTGEVGEVYTVTPYIDSGAGPQAGDNPLFARVSQQDPYAELERSAPFQANGGWRISVWINADKANTTFNVFSANLWINRLSPQMEDAPAARSIPLGGPEPPPPPPLDDDEEDEDEDEL